MIEFRWKEVDGKTSDEHTPTNSVELGRAGYIHNKDAVLQYRLTHCLVQTSAKDADVYEQALYPICDPKWVDVPFVSKDPVARKGIVR
jgi:hypothetical protein